MFLFLKSLLVSIVCVVVAVLMLVLIYMFLRCRLVFVGSEACKEAIDYGAHCVPWLELFLICVVIFVWS